jgi:hypothetical protein
VPPVVVEPSVHCVAPIAVPSATGVAAASVGVTVVVAGALAPLGLDAGVLASPWPDVGVAAPLGLLPPPPPHAASINSAVADAAALIQRLCPSFVMSQLRLLV